jgi:predicted phosphodiesterase
MKIALISDIHSNLEALLAVKQDIEKKNFDEVYCLGDIVGYGANPSECIEVVRGFCKSTIMGNHDHASIGLTSVEMFNPYAKLAVKWTMEHLTDSNKEYLKSLKFTLNINNKILLVHSSPFEPDKWNYILSEYDALIAFSSLNSQRIVFIGHSHQPIVFFEDQNEDIHYSMVKNLTFDNLHRYIINIGSVGQPRDLNPRACYIGYDLDNNSLEYYRIDYDIETATKKIVDAGLPQILAERLKYGK